MAYSWDNRVDFVVRYMYDIDNNGFLDKADFECMALRACIIEGKGEYNTAKLAEYQHIMRELWSEISDLADFDKDGKISTEEFKQAVQKTCIGKKYADFPQAMKAFIKSQFQLIDVDGDGIVGAKEFRYNCITRIAVESIQVVDDAFNKLLDDEDRRRGGLTLERYQELYGHYLGNTDETHPGVYLFGPLSL